MHASEWQVRWSPTLGELESTHQEVWGTSEYVDKTRPVVFMGLYSLKDFIALWNHLGKKAILWCGSDITRFKQGYWLDETGKIKLNPKALAQWINLYCDSWVENEVEQEALKKLGIYSRICPSFLGDVSKFQVSFQPGNKLYTSVSGDNFQLYGWDKLDKLAFDNPDVEFHCYGTSHNLQPVFKNIFNHGRVPKEQMNQEIKDMQGALRLTKFDGCSEIIVKAMLMGQYAFSYIKYPGVNRVEDIKLLTSFTEPNPIRQWWIENLNQFPWNV